MIRTEACPFYRTISGVRLYWVLEEPKGPKGSLSLWQKPEPTLSKEHRKAAKSRLKELEKELKAAKKVPFPAPVPGCCFLFLALTLGIQPCVTSLRLFCTGLFSQNEVSVFLERPSGALPPTGSTLRHDCSLPGRHTLGFL